MDQVFSRESLSEAVSGAIADTFSSTLLYPLDVIKARTQTQKGTTIASVINEVGVRNLWHGCSDKWIVSPQQKFQYFYFENGLTALFKQYAKREPTTYEVLLIGYIAALQGTLTTLPLDVTNVRRMTSKDPATKKQSFWQSFAENVQRDGFMEFYAGWPVAAVLCINPAITFQVFALLKQWWVKYTNNANAHLSTLEAFVIGALAKVVATYVTFPLIRLKAVLNTWTKLHAGEKTPSATDALHRIVTEEGVTGLYKGISPQLVKGVLNSAIMLAVKEKIDATVKKAIL